QAEDGIRDFHVTGVQTCALPISEDDGRDRGDREPARGGCVMSVELGAWLHEAAERMDEACVRCGRCFEVCPVTPWSAAKGADPVATVGNVLDALVRDARLDEAAEGWIRSCNSCGICIDACPEKVNPRRMLTLSTTRLASQGTRTPELFKRMSRSIRLMLAMQVVPEEFRR